MNNKFTDFIIGLLIGIIVLTVVISMVTIIKKDDKTEKSVDHTLVRIDSVTVNCAVFYDKDTHVMYLVNYHGGVTVMVNPDGSPRLYKEDNDD